MNITEGLSIMGVDQNELLNRFSGNAALMERFIKKYPEDKTFGQLSNAVHNKIYEDIEKATHTLKGITANLGFKALYSLCNELVLNLRSGRRETVDELFLKIQEEHHNILSVITRL